MYTYQQTLLAERTANAILNEQWRMESAVIGRPAFARSVREIVAEAIAQAVQREREEVQRVPFDQEVLAAVARGDCALTTYGHEVTPAEAQQRLESPEAQERNRLALVHAEHFWFRRAGQMEAERDRLREALKPWMESQCFVTNGAASPDCDCWVCAHVKAARAALEGGVA